MNNNQRINSVIVRNTSVEETSDQRNSETASRLYHPAFEVEFDVLSNSRFVFSVIFVVNKTPNFSF